jgi:NAD(P)-dependent dehydrogenase (short-subunit alcohol dehydrogenase family)
VITIDLAGRVALICGAGAGGIGSAVTRAMAGAGATVAALDHSAELNAATVQDLARDGLSCETFVADLMNRDEAAKVVDRVLAKLGRIDILVNVAGGTRHHQWGPLEDSPDSVFRDVFALNLDYVMRLCADTARHMIARGGGGAMVNFASVSALRSAPYHGPYGAAKAGVSAITETMAVEWARHGIRVNAIGPGSVRTPRVMQFTAGEDPQAHPDGRRSVSTGEIANGVLFLASDLASGITGQTLTIDAGLALGHPAGPLFHWEEMRPKPAG